MSGVLKRLPETSPFSQGIQAYVNYWEIKPSQYGARLQDFAVRGIRTISTFIPWSHFETDIHHSLRKFLKAAFETRLNVRLFVMPTLGISYPNCGIPKELLSNHANLAADKNGALIMNRSAPNIFPLPSFSSPEVLKAFGNYLIKVSSTIADVCKEVNAADWIEIVITQSLVDNYRNPGLSEHDHGDFSAASVIAFRDFLKKNQKTEMTNAIHEGFNQHLFFKHIENQLRKKTEMIFAKKNHGTRITQGTLSCPESDPANSNAVLASEVLGFKPPVESFYKSIKNSTQSESVMPTVFLSSAVSSAGGMKKISQEERDFLVLSSMIHTARVLIPMDLLLGLSSSLHSKLREFESAHLRLKNTDSGSQLVYFTASPYSAENKTYAMLKKASGTNVTIVTSAVSFSSNSRGMSEKLIFVDPKALIGNTELLTLLSSAQAGKVVAIPACVDSIGNYETAAFEQVQKLRRLKTPLKLNVGIQHEVLEIGLGFAVFYNPTNFYVEAQPLSNEGLALFIRAMIGLSEVKAKCLCENENIDVVSLHAREDSTASLHFVLNPTAKPQTVNLKFSRKQYLEFAGERMLSDVLETAVGAHGVLIVHANEVSVSDYDGAELNFIDENTTSDVRFDGTQA